MKSLAGRASVFKEDPLKLVRLDSEPEPDIVAISSPDIEDDGKESSRPVLVIEVAESSLRYDLNAKAPLYSEANVPEYCVLNLVDRELVVFRSPKDGDYRERASYRSGDRVAPEAWPDVVIEVSRALSHPRPVLTRPDPNASAAPRLLVRLHLPSTSNHPWTSSRGRRSPRRTRNRWPSGVT